MRPLSKLAIASAVVAICASAQAQSQSGASLGKQRAPAEKNCLEKLVSGETKRACLEQAERREKSASGKARYPRLNAVPTVAPPPSTSGR